jgi:hypothetical protein
MRRSSMTDCKISILGAEWEILHRLRKENKYLKECNGYTDYTIRRIVVRRFPKPPKYYEYQALENHAKKAARHEIIHAFLYESGLAGNSGEADTWAMNEEMIDWIVFQHGKLHKAFEEAGAL